MFLITKKLNQKNKKLLNQKKKLTKTKEKVESKCEDGMEKIRSAAHQNQSYVVETITMTTVTERRIIREREAIENRTASGQPTVNKACSETEKTVEDNESNGGVKSTLVTAILQPSIERSTYLTNSSDGKLTTSAQIAGILKGGKLWKSEVTQVSFPNNLFSSSFAILLLSMQKKSGKVLQFYYLNMEMFSSYFSI